MTNAVMTNYYAKCAVEYDHIYHKPERQENLKQLQTVIAESFKGLNLSLMISCRAYIQN